LPPNKKARLQPSEYNATDQVSSIPQQQPPAQQQAASAREPDQSEKMGAIPSEITIHSDASSVHSPSQDRTATVNSRLSPPLQRAVESSQQDADSKSIGEDELPQTLRATQQPPAQQQTASNNSAGQQTQNRRDPFWYLDTDSSAPPATPEYFPQFQEAQDMDASTDSESRGGSQNERRETRRLRLLGVSGGQQESSSQDSISTTQMSTDAESNSNSNSASGRQDRGPRDDRSLGGMGL
jgi:hypothetical protein